MFDNIRVKASLPLPHELLPLRTDWSSENFQTKDLENSLSLYEICPDGKLRHLKQDREWKEEETSFLGGYFDVTGETWEEVPYHGVIEFYTTVSDKIEYEPDLINNPESIDWDRLVEIEGYDWWVEFAAVFDNGSLREIRLRKLEKTLIRKRLAENKQWAERRKHESSKLANRIIRKLRKIPGYRSATRLLGKLELKCHERISAGIRKIS